MGYGDEKEVWEAYTILNSIESGQGAKPQLITPIKFTTSEHTYYAMIDTGA